MAIDFTKPIHGEAWTLMARSTAMQLKEDNQIEVVNWCSGALKGTKLKPKNREVEIFCGYRQEELRARVSDWIVRLERFNSVRHYYLIFPDGVFQHMFQQGE